MNEHLHRMSVSLALLESSISLHAQESFVLNSIAVTNFAEIDFSYIPHFVDIYPHCMGNVFIAALNCDENDTLVCSNLRDIKSQFLKIIFIR